MISCGTGPIINFNFLFAFGVDIKVFNLRFLYKNLKMSFQSTYQSIHELVEKCPFVDEDICQISGQGLVHCYNVNCYGTGENHYLFELSDYKDPNITYLFHTCDNFILNWRIRSYPECSNGVEYDNFEFNAFGYLDNHLSDTRLYSRHCNDPSLFDLGKLKKITVYLADQSLRPISGISNCYIYIDEIMTPRDQFIDQFRTKHLDKTKFPRRRLRQVIDQDEVFLFVPEGEGDIYRLKLLEKLEITDEEKIIFEIKGIFEISVDRPKFISPFPLTQTKLEIEINLTQHEYTHDPETGEEINDPDADDECHINFTLNRPERKNNFDLYGFISIPN